MALNSILEGVSSTPQYCGHPTQNLTLLLGISSQQAHIICFAVTFFWITVRINSNSIVANNCLEDTLHVPYWLT